MSIDPSFMRESQARPQHAPLAQIEGDQFVYTSGAVAFIAFSALQEREGHRLSEIDSRNVND